MPRPQVLSVISRGKSRVVFLMQSDHESNTHKFNIAISFFSDIVNRIEVKMFFKSPQNYIKKFNVSIPLEVRPFVVPIIEKGFRVGRRNFISFWPKQDEKIYSLLSRLEEPEKIKLYQMNPYVNGTTLSKIKNWSTKLKTDLLKMLVQFWETGFIHGDLTGGNIMYGNVAPTQNKRWVLIDLDDMRRHKKITFEKKYTFDSVAFKLRKKNHPDYQNFIILLLHINDSKKQMTKNPKTQKPKKTKSKMTINLC